MLEALHRAQQRISEGMLSRRLDPAVHICHVAADDGHLVLGVADTAPAARRKLHALAGGVPLRLFSCAPAVRHANKRDYNRPLLGGIYISCPAVTGEGTICISATRAGVPGFVTCGHVVGQAGVDVYQPRQSSTNNWLAGRSTVVSNYTGHAASDSAFVALAGGVAMTPAAIWKSYQAIGIYDAPAPGTAVSMQGASTQTTLRSGIVCGKNVTVTFADGGVLSNQLLANYLSTTGDSGAPVFYPLDGTSVLLVGLNVGATQPAYTNPPPNPAVYPPASNGTYAVISPWSNVESDLGLSLGLAVQTP
jgi:hypothetical protein